MINVKDKGEQITAIIADDEPLARDLLRTYLKKFPNFAIIGESKDGKDTIRKVNKLKPQVLFLDIQMPEANGFEVLEGISNEEMPVVVFVTAYEKHAIKAFELNATDYLLKPFNEIRFENSMKRIEANLAFADNKNSLENDTKAGKLSIETGIYNVTVIRNVNLGFQSFTSITYSGANFLPLSGFASDAGFADVYTNNGYYWKPKEKTKVANYELDLQLYEKYRLKNKNFENSDYYFYGGIYYADGSIIRMLYNWNREFLPFDWNFSKSITLPKAYYNNNLLLFKYVSKVTRNVKYQSKIGVGIPNCIL